MDIKDTDVVRLNTEEYSFSSALPSISLGKSDVIEVAADLMPSTGIGNVLFVEGFKGAILRPGADWVQGKYFLRLEFVPDADSGAMNITPES